MQTTLLDVRRILTVYGMTTYLALGNIGLIINLMIFSQRQHRRNACSLYILATSASSLLGLNSAVIPHLYALNNESLIVQSVFLCQLIYYLRHTFSQMMRTFIVLACIDRYLSCRNPTRSRWFLNEYQIAVRVIAGVILFWLLLGLFPSSLQTISNHVCDVFNSTHVILFSVYIILVLCILPLLSMITFSVMLLINLRRIRKRINPTSINSISRPSTILRRRDFDMIRMILIEILFYICTSIPLTISLFYRVITQNSRKSAQHHAIEDFITFISRTFLLYINNSVSFWIYISTSRSFRFEVKSLFLRIHTFLICKSS